MRPEPIEGFALGKYDLHLLGFIRQELMAWRSLARTPDELGTLGAALVGLDAFTNGERSAACVEIWTDPRDRTVEGVYATFRLNQNDILLGIGDLALSPYGKIEWGSARLWGLTGAGAFNDEEVAGWITVAREARSKAAGLEAVEPRIILPRPRMIPEGGTCGWMLSRPDADLLHQVRSEVWSWTECADAGDALIAIADVARALDQILDREEADCPARAALRISPGVSSHVMHGIDVTEEAIELWRLTTMQADEHKHVAASLDRDGAFPCEVVEDWLRAVRSFRHEMGPLAEGGTLDEILE